MKLKQYFFWRTFDLDLHSHPGNIQHLPEKAYSTTKTGINWFLWVLVSFGSNLRSNLPQGCWETNHQYSENWATCCITGATAAQLPLFWKILVFLSRLQYGDKLFRLHFMCFPEKRNTRSITPFSFSTETNLKHKWATEFSSSTKTHFHPRFSDLASFLWAAKHTVTFSCCNIRRWLNAQWLYGLRGSCFTHWLPSISSLVTHSPLCLTSHWSSICGC